jgi:hypothetical protein
MFQIQQSSQVILINYGQLQNKNSQNRNQKQMPSEEQQPLLEDSQQQDKNGN